MCDGRDAAGPDIGVVGLYTSVRAGAAMETHDEVEVVPGAGIPGDRYATGRGHWSDPRWPDQELTFFAGEVARELQIDPQELRRNVVTQGVDLDSLIGATFRLGSALLQGVRPCDPCGHIERLTRPGMNAALRNRGGLRARVLSAGTIRLGDRPDVVPAEAVKGASAGISA